MLWFPIIFVFVVQLYALWSFDHMIESQLDNAYEQGIHILVIIICLKVKLSCFKQKR
jgi:hypothetical protein